MRMLMTLIRVDPEELQVTATVMNACAAELAELQVSLPSCLQCVIPPEIAGLVQQIVTTIGSIVGVLAQFMGNDANELVNRATTAANDSLAVATSATVGVIGGNSAPLDGVAVLGGSGRDYSTTDVTSGVPGYNPGVLGGSGRDYSTTDVTSGVPGYNPGVLGGSGRDYSTPDVTGGGNSTAGFLGGGNPSARTTEIKFSPVSPSDVFSGMLFQKGIGFVNLPSRSTMEHQLGYPLSLTQYHTLVPGGFDGFIGG